MRAERKPSVRQKWPIRRFFMKLVIIALVFWSTFGWLGHFYTQIQVKIKS
jgi:hypothetical protein